jgi:Flp pilus assembly protein TadD
LVLLIAFLVLPAATLVSAPTGTVLESWQPLGWMKRRVADTPQKQEETTSTTVLSQTGTPTWRIPKKLSARRGETTVDPALASEASESAAGKVVTSRAGKAFVPSAVVSTPRRDSKPDERPVDAYVRADRLYRTGQIRDAVEAFQVASAGDIRNPLYSYLLAMALYRAGELDQAQRSFDRAVVLEQQFPIKNWGRRLSRYQGHPRIWLEQKRSSALRDSS